MPSTIESPDPFFPTYDPETLIRAHTALLSELKLVLNSMPQGKDANDPTKIQEWLDETTKRWIEGDTIPEHLLGQSWSDFIFSYVNPWLKPIRASVHNAKDEATSFTTAEVKKVRDDLEDLVASVEERVGKVEGFFENIAAKVRSGLWDVAKYPIEQFSKDVETEITHIVEPVHKKLESALDLFTVARKLAEADVLAVKDRLVWVGDAFEFLLNNEEVSLITDALSDVIHGDVKDLEDNLEKLVTEVVVKSSPMAAMLYWVGKSVSKGQLYVSEKDLGIGLTPGRLFEFINGPNSKTGKPLHPDERDFRIELVSSLDRYFHGEYDTSTINSSLTVPRTTFGVDGKSTVQTLTDIFRLFLQTSFGFVFRVPHMPSIMAPKMSLLQPIPQHLPQLVAARHASATLSRALAAPIKGVSGLLLRGFWEISTHNEALVELISSSFAQIIGSLVESLSHSLFSLLEIREVYDNPQGTTGCLVSWSTAAQWCDKPKQSTYQAVFVRSGFLDHPKKEDKLSQVLQEYFEDLPKPDDSVLTSLLKDYGTYLELSRECHEPDIGDSSITVTASWKANWVTVHADFEDPASADPGLVLRVYAAGKHAIMDKSYNAKLQCDIDSIDIVHVFAGAATHGSLDKSDITTSV